MVLRDVLFFATVLHHFLRVATKIMECKRRGSSRRTVFCKGFAPLMAFVNEGKRDVLFFAMVFVHFRHPRGTLYCFLQGF